MHIVLTRSANSPVVARTIEGSFSEVVARLTAGKVAPPPDEHLKDKEKRARVVPCWAPVTLEPQTTSIVNKTIAQVTALVLDIDTNAPPPARAAGALARYSAWIHTSTSHTPESPRLRIVFELSRAVDTTEFKRLWKWAVTLLNMVDIQADAQVCDPRRLWYIPFPQREHFESIITTGKPVDVEEVLALDASEAPIVIDQERTLDDAQVYDADKTVVDVREWAKAAPVGDKLRCFCPTLAVEDHKSVSAFIRRLERHVFICCTSGTHEHAGHYTAYVRLDAADVKERPNKPDYARRAMDASIADYLDWDHDKNGIRTKVLPTRHNLYQILARDQRYADRIWFNGFSDHVMLDNQQIDDKTMFMLQAEVERTYRIQVPHDMFWHAMAAAANQRIINPLVEYLQNLVWDTVPRLSTLATRAFKAPPDPLYSEVVKKWCIQAVARALNPGCKADTVLVLPGDQGFLKSTALQTLAGEDWFADTQLQLGGNKVYLQISAKWIFELGEMASIKRSDVETVKQFLSGREDTFVAPYGKLAETRKRHCTFASTTNEQLFLNDDTGSRRFWPVPVQSRCDVAYIREFRDQLWAEAVARYKAGEAWWFDGEGEKAIKRIHEKHQETHPWEAAIQEWLATSAPPAVTVEKILTDLLEIPRKDWKPFHKSQLGKYMAKAWGPAHRVRAKDGLRLRVFFNPLLTPMEITAYLRAQYATDDVEDEGDDGSA